MVALSFLIRKFDGDENRFSWRQLTGNYSVINYIWSNHLRKILGMDKNTMHLGRNY